MTNNKLPAASVVALNGCRYTPSRLEASYNDLLAWFESLNAPPDKLSVQGEGFTGKVGAFRSIDSRLKKSGFSAIRGFSLFHLKPGGEVPLRDWLVTADVTTEKSDFVIGVSSSICDLPCVSLLSASKTAIKTLEPTYGIGFRREMRLGPTLYAAGLVQGLQPWGDEKPEGEKIDAWRTIGLKNKVYEQGILRDVYPWNFLTNPQLSRQIEGKSLKQWIEAHSEFGTVSVVAENTYLWEIPESQISRVRSALQNARMIFDAATAALR